MSYKHLDIILILSLLFISLSATSGMAQSTTTASTSTTATNIITGVIEGSSLQVSLSNQNPDAARPGEPVELTFTVQNVGNNNLRNDGKINSNFINTYI